MSLPPTPPPGWGNDGLTSFFDSVRQNQYAVFHNHSFSGRIIAIDELFMKLLDRPINPRSMMPMTFMLLAHSSWRAGAAAAMSGQVYESNALLRAALESTSYGLFIGDDAHKFEVFMARHDTPDGAEKVRSAFSARKMAAHLRTMSAPLADDFDTLYDMMIDNGAHPNQRGITFNSVVREESGNKIIDTVYLHADGLALDLGLKNVVRVGMTVLHLFRLLYAPKFELLGVTAALDEMRANPL